MTSYGRVDNLRFDHSAKHYKRDGHVGRVVGSAGDVVCVGVARIVIRSAGSSDYRILDLVRVDSSRIIEIWSICRFD